MNSPALLPAMPIAGDVFGAVFGTIDHTFESAGPLSVWLIVMTFVFIECAFIIGMFLPGDSMLLGAGVVLAQQTGPAHAWALSVVATLLAVTGNQVGYLIGRRTGTRVWARQGGRVLNRRHLERAHRFFERWGFWAVVVARWLPWVRTLAPVVAGATRMDRRVFLTASIIGAVAWVPGLILLGFYGAGLIEQLSWLAPAVTILVVAGFVITVGVGLWRYQQDMGKPVDDSADLPQGSAPARGTSAPGESALETSTLGASALGASARGASAGQRADLPPGAEVPRREVDQPVPGVSLAD